MFLISRIIEGRNERKAPVWKFEDIYFSDDTYSASVFFLINEERVRRHVAPLEFDADLATEAANGDRRRLYFIIEADEEDQVGMCFRFWKNDPAHLNLWSEETKRIGVFSYEEKVESDVYRVYVAKFDE